MTESLTSNPWVYRVTGLSMLQAYQVAELLAGGSVIWVQGKTFPADGVVIEPMRSAEPPPAQSSKEAVSIPEAASVGRKLRQDHASSGAAWSFEDWLTIRYEELRRRFEKACAEVTRLSEPPNDLPETLPVDVQVNCTIFRKGVKTRLALDSLRRQAEIAERRAKPRNA